MNGIQPQGDAADGMPFGAGTMAAFALEGLLGLALMLLVIIDFVHH